MTTSEVIDQVPGATKVKLIFKVLTYLNKVLGIVDKFSIWYSHYLHDKKREKLMKKQDRDEYEKRFIARNYYMNENNECYTILNDNTIIYTRTLKLQVFEDGDLHYRFQGSSSNLDFPVESQRYDKSEAFKRSILDNKNRFNKFSFAFDVLEDSINKDHLIKPEIEKIDIDAKDFCIDIKIPTTSKKQKITLAFSLTLPKDFESKYINTDYKSTTGILNINIQKDIYGIVNENNNFRPKLTSKCDSVVYHPLSYKSLYYHTFKWKIWQWNWCDGKITLNYKG